MSAQEVAQTILSQIGGNRSMVMIGGKNICVSRDKCGALSFKHMPAKVDGKRSNYCKVSLTDMDLYEVEFGYVTSKKYEVRKVVDQVCGDQLMEIFSTETGLSLRL